MATKPRAQAHKTDEIEPRETPQKTVVLSNTTSSTHVRGKETTVGGSATYIGSHGYGGDGGGDGGYGGDGGGDYGGGDYGD